MTVEPSLKRPISSPFNKATDHVRLLRPALDDAFARRGNGPRPDGFDNCRQ